MSEVYVDGTTPLNATHMNALQQKVEKGANNGYPSLDSGGKIPSAQLPSGVWVPLSSVGAASGVAALDSGTKVPVAQLPAGTANGVASLDGTGKVPSSQLPATTGGGTFTVNQTSHGFSVGNVLTLSGTTYAKAKADTAANAEVVGIVDSVTDANNFVLRTVGKITGLTGLTAGTAYFLDPVTAGALTATEPTTANQVSKPLLIADTTTSGYFYNFRGQVISPSLLATVATTLPGSPVDGQQAILVDSTSTPTYSWLVQWSSVASRWLFIGGTPVVKRVETSETTTSTTFADLTTVGPSFTVPRAGVYVCLIGANANQNTASNDAYIGLRAGSTAATDLAAFRNISSGSQNQVSIATVFQTAAVVASDVLKVQYRIGGTGTAQFLMRSLQVVPVYLT